MAPVSSVPSSTPTSVLTGRMLLVALVSAVSGLLHGDDTGILSGALREGRSRPGEPAR